MTPDEELVGEGSFRVAGERALEVLRAAQLKESFWRPLLWLRAAAALGAEAVEMTSRATAVDIALAGPALPRRLLSDPVSLAAEEGAPPAARWLAYALIHTAVEGVSVTLSSGEGKARRAYAFDASCRGAPAEPAPGADTVVAVRWPVVVPTFKILRHAPWTWFSTQEDHEPRRRLEAADAVPFRLSTPLGTVRPWERRKDPDAGVLAADGRRARVRPAAAPGRLSLHHFGVEVHGAVLEDTAFPMAVDLDDPALLLDASLAAPVRGPELERAGAAALAAAARWGLARLERHARAMRLCARLLLERPGLRGLWGESLAVPRPVGKRLSALSRARSALAFGKAPGGDALRVVRAAEFTAFLRKSALGSLRGRTLDARDPLRKALWETPLLFTATGRPVSLAELELDERAASLWEGGGPAPAGAGAMMVWALSRLDAGFVRSFPRRGARVE